MPYQDIQWNPCHALPCTAVELASLLFYLNLAPCSRITPCSLVAFIFLAWPGSGFGSGPGSGRGVHYPPGEVPALSLKPCPAFLPSTRPGPRLLSSTSSSLLTGSKKPRPLSLHWIGLDHEAILVYFLYERSIEATRTLVLIELNCGTRRSL